MKNFIKDKDIASITPTSPFGVKRVCSQIDFARNNLIIEYGPGTGVFTDYLLKHMRNGSRLIAIERNKNFKTILQDRIHDPRATIINDSAENVLETLKACRSGEADYIISGIPFFWLPRDLKDRILLNTYRALKEGGSFLVYQTCFQTDQHLKVHLERFFPVVHSKFELRNIPPLRLFQAIKGSQSPGGNGNGNGNGNGSRSRRITV
ncbi:MAG: methyltransferase domain-containing protein [Syntrophobacteraceae bacterium]|nr:methyltransferase domain-containing protein [Syntrophobacteraceae bacterium]